MKERPILFNDEMVRAVLEGRKLQTRRLVPEWQIPAKTAGTNDEFPDSRWISVAQRDRRYGFGVFGATERKCMDNYNADFSGLCPYGDRGDRLWVREAFCASEFMECTYRADGANRPPCGWSPSIHMWRRASRITLEITDVRVERLQDITEEDARAEGIYDGGCLECGESEPCGCDHPTPDARDAFIHLWQSIYGRESWAANPWVWVIEFRRVDQ